MRPKGECVLMDGFKVIKPFRLIDYDIKLNHLFLDERSKDLWREGEQWEYEIHPSNPNYARLLKLL